MIHDLLIAAVTAAFTIPAGWVAAHRRLDRTLAAMTDTELRRLSQAVAGRRKAA